MSTRACTSALIRQIPVVLGTAVISILTPGIARSAQSISPRCDALVSVADDLYLVGSGGTVISRFTSDGTTKMYPTISPDGHQVAYVVAEANQGNIDQYEVADADGRQRSFAINTETGDLSSPKFDAYPLIGLWWNARDMLRLTKHVSPGTSLFEFQSMHPHSGGRGRMLGTGFGDGCNIMGKDGGLVACVQDTAVRVGNHVVLSESGFPATPIASFTLAQGDSVTMPSVPTFTVTVVGVHNGHVGLKVVSPDGTWETGFIPGSEDYFTTWWNGIQYGFSAHLVNRTAGLVQIEEFAGRRAGSSIFDSAIAWQPQGPGLLLIRREGGQALIELIQPPDHHQDRHRARGGDHSWTLSAQARIDMPKEVQQMRFVSPSVLLFRTAGGAFSWASIQISNGRPSQHENLGKPAPGLTVGAMTQLPSTVPATIDGTTSEQRVLDWSCSVPQDDRGGRYRF